MADETSEADAPTEDSKASSERSSPRKIPGNLPYTTSPGVLKRALDGVAVSEKPTVFNRDFVNTVLGLTGGASMPIIPIFKATGLVSQSGVPTELYSQFQTEGGRANAALQAQKNGFPELFKRNQYANRTDEKTLTDLIVSVTGLPRSERIVGYIRSTFQLFQDIARNAREETVSAPSDPVTQVPVISLPKNESQNSLGLIYNINVVLPETTNIEVYNAIFKSLKGNLLV
jgi:hypothetical protein